MKLDYLDSKCFQTICSNPTCNERIKQRSETGRWYITMGHPGFNSPANNREGYSSQKLALAASLRYQNKSAPKIFHTCTIQRTKKVTHGTMNLLTGKTTSGKAEIVTEACDVPLFNQEEQATGICKSCKKGWECEGNTFANTAEKSRATRVSA